MSLLLPGWQDLIDGANQSVAQAVLARPLDPVRAPAQVRVAATAVDAWDLVRSLQATPLGAIAIVHAMPPEAGRFVAPSAVGLAAWGTDGAVFASVLDVRVAGVLDALGSLLRLPITWVGHDLKQTLFALWASGLDPQLRTVHDTRIAALALHLGEGHSRARSDGVSIQQRIEAEAERERFFTLAGQCDHHRIALSMAPPATTSIDGVDVGSLASRAIWTSRLYLAQQPAIVSASLQSHLATIEFPFVEANARIEYRGVAVGADRIDKLREGCRRAAAEQAETLRSFGVDPPGSTDALERVLREQGLAERIDSLDDAELRRLAPQYPVAGAFARHRRFRQLAREPWQRDGDRRVHPEHRQLGAATGRNGCRRPNLTGLSRVLRPVVVAPIGRALIEFDYCQMESGVAAAEHDDPALIEAFNQGDVYAAAAQAFYVDELSEAERAMSPAEFARERPDLRASMKPFVLAVLYGGGAKTIAEKHKISVQVAQERIDRFLALYPKLAAGLEADSAMGEARGYALIRTGLRRTFDRSAPGGWVRNLLRNTPIQGGAAVVMKGAVIRLDEEFRDMSVWTVATIHDAVLIECDAADVQWVRKQVPEVMIAAFRKFYPQLRPRIDVNDADVSCWNKKGHADSLEKFLADPNYTIESGAPADQDACWFELDGDDPGPGLDEALDAELRRLMAERGVSLGLAEWHERFDERAAIREYDGGQARDEAEAAARVEVIAAFVDALDARGGETPPTIVESGEDPFVAQVLDVFGGTVEPVSSFRAEAEMSGVGQGKPDGGRK